MNLSLHDPQFITADFPTTLTTTLSYGHSTALQISPCGHYIASGLLDGTVLIIDTWTNNVTCMMRTHSKPVVGVKWMYHESNDDDENDENDENVAVGLLTWSRDWKVCLQGLKNQKMELIWEFSFPGGVWNVDIINPGVIDKETKDWIDWEIVICRAVNGVGFVKYCKGMISENLEVEDCKSGLNSLKNKDSDVYIQDYDKEVMEMGDGVPLCCCSFFGGKFVIVGTSKGWLQIIDVKTKTTVKWMKVCNGNVKGISIVERGFYENSELKFGSNNVPISRMIVNASDRILRQYDISSWYELNNDSNSWKCDLEQKYQDVVNRIQWNTVKFSPTGEYVCASTQGGSGAAHDVYIWETSMGSLVQILEGAHEELIDVDWGSRSTNGNVCCISSNGMDSGTIFVWGVRASQKWSALAPDFEEIEQNIEYVEHEDEFDLTGVGSNQFENGNETDKFENFKVDVVTREQTDARGFKFIKGCIIETQL